MTFRLLVCITCGGRGHVSRIDGKVCLTRELGVQIPLDELAKTNYPGSITFPKLNLRARKNASGSSSGSRVKAKARVVASGAGRSTFQYTTHYIMTRLPATPARPAQENVHLFQREQYRNSSCSANVYQAICVAPFLTLSTVKLMPFVSWTRQQTFYLSNT